MCANLVQSALNNSDHLKIQAMNSVIENILHCVNQFDEFNLEKFRDMIESLSLIMKDIA